MCNGEVLSGTCGRCGKKGTLIRRKRDFPGIKCECHSPNHFDLKLLCEDCNKLDNITIFGVRTKIDIGSISGKRVYFNLDLTKYMD